MIQQHMKYVGGVVSCCLSDWLVSDETYTIHRFAEVVSLLSSGITHFSLNLETNAPSYHLLIIIVEFL